MKIEEILFFIPRIIANWYGGYLVSKEDNECKEINNITPAAITTVLITLGMTWEEADESLDMFCDWHGHLPLKLNHLQSIWNIYKDRY